MLKVEETPLAVLVEDGLEGMMYEHWKETMPELEFDPDWATALEMEKTGSFKAYGLYRDGRLSGYAAFDVAPHLFFKGTKQAFNAAIYVDPKERGFAGLYLVRRCEELFREEKFKRIIYGAPSASALKKVLGHLGYEETETLFAKVLL